MHPSPSSWDAPTINSATISASSFDCTPKCGAPSVCLQPKSRRWQPMATPRQQFKLALQGNPCQKNTTRKLQNPSIIRVTGAQRKLHQRHTRRTHVLGQAGPKLFREEILRRKFARCANEWVPVCAHHSQTITQKAPAGEFESTFSILRQDHPDYTASENMPFCLRVFFVRGCSKILCPKECFLKKFFFLSTHT